MAKHTITATIVFEVEAPDTQTAAELAWLAIEVNEHRPENIQVWDEEPNHWFADRYTYANQPVLIEPNPQGPQTLNKMPAKVEAKVEDHGQVLAVDMPAELDQLGSIA